MVSNSLLILLILIAIGNIAQSVHQTALSDYDKFISSSSFGEPVFRLQPPNVIQYSNKQGATLVCLASGNPKPSITWFTSPSSFDVNQLASLSGDNLLNDLNSRPVTNVSNLRQILQDGSVVKLMPYKEYEFRPDIHSAGYRCVASNQVATIHSKFVSLQAVIQREQAPPEQTGAGGSGSQVNSVRLNDEFVTLNSTAVLKCKLQLDAWWWAPPLAGADSQLAAAQQQSGQPTELQPGGGPAQVAVEWFTSDGLQLGPNERLALGPKANKFAVAFESGELHLTEMEMSDLRRTYGCRLRNSTSRRVIASSNLAQLILSADDEQRQREAEHGWRVLHSVERVVASEAPGDSLSEATSSALELPHDSDATSYAGLQQQQQQQQRGGNGRRSKTSSALLLPCAVRQPASLRAGRWLFQAASPEQAAGSGQYVSAPLTLEQLARANRRWLQLRTADEPAEEGGALRSRQNTSQAAGPALAASKLVVGPTFLAIERPRSQLSGRFLFVDAAELAAHTMEHSRGSPQPKTICDISVIIRRPISAQLTIAAARSGREAGSGADGDNVEDNNFEAMELSPSDAQSVGLAHFEAGALSAPPERSSVWAGFQAWLAGGVPEDLPAAAPLRANRAEAAIFQQASAPTGVPASLLDSDLSRIRVSGRGAAPQTPIVRVGGRLELSCLAAGFPIDSIRWFRQGQEVSAQSSDDFQTEVGSSFLVIGESGRVELETANASELSARLQAANATTGSGGSLLVRSRLSIKRLQARDSGFQMFECFVQNSFGERARVARAVYVADKRQLQSTRAKCPLEGAGPRQQESTGNEDADAADEDEAPARARSLLERRNPFKRALVIEGEPIELRCPAAGQPAASGPQVEWFKFAEDNEERQRTGGASGARAPFNQLFGGDSRFVMNGSSLQIRSPSKRHDETLFVCLRRAGAAQAPGAQSPLQLAGRGQHRRRRLTPSPARSQPARAVHQSSEAAPAPACLESIFSAWARPQADSAGQSDARRTFVSSISIKMAAKPKIDPFEFSRNLEEGMRTVVVCAVVSGGQSQVDINWFKDGELLLEDKPDSASKTAESDIGIDRANGFSSTLTFRRIKPAHSGLYTCIASNALAVAEHSSRLLVNVAPYFLEAPKSQRAYLNSNVMINCQAEGQPSPQIRWRKLVPIAAGGSGQLTAGEHAKVSPFDTSVGSTTKIASAALQTDSLAPSSGSLGFYSPAFFAPSAAALVGEPGPDDLTAPHQMALVGAQQQQQQQTKHEFRVITSNSHIQVLENGSMIIRQIELADAARYSCQASNGVQPILSEVIDLQVLSPAQFAGVNYETVSVKRDSSVRLNCAPRGDPPLQLDWFKEGFRLERASPQQRASHHQHQTRRTKYSEVVHALELYNSRASGAEPGPLGGGAVLANGSAASKQYDLVLLDQRLSAEGFRQEEAREQQTEVGSPAAASQLLPGGEKWAPVASELVVSAADRSDSGLFVCLARNPHGKDELTYRLVVLEPPDAPASLQVLSVRSASLKLVWQAPFDGNSPITHFVVEYRKVAPASAQVASKTTDVVGAAGQHADWSRALVNGALHNDELGNSDGQQQAPGDASTRLAQSKDPPATTASPSSGSHPRQATSSVTLKQLAPKSSYQLRVAAANALGQGPFSSVQLVQTAEDPPRVGPSDLRAQPLSTSAIRLMWHGPVSAAGGSRQSSVPQLADEAPIRGYYISHRLKWAKTSPAASLAEAGELANRWIATVSMSADNYTAAQAPSDLRASLTGEGSVVGGERAQPQLVAYEYLLQLLDTNAEYEIRVQPFNLMGVGPAGELVAQTLKFDRPAPPSLKLVAARRQSLELKWTVSSASLPPVSSPLSPRSGEQASGRGQQQQPTSADQSAARLLGFSLYFKCEFDDWQEIQLTLVFHYIIENLRCGNKYQIYLSAYNSVGRSDPSDVLSVRTEGSVPRAPDKGAFIRANISEAQLDMSAWSTGGCPITSFMIQFKRLHDSNWFILSEGASPFVQTDKITIPDLAPASWFKLLVTALNEAGSTNAEFIFSTLTLDGKQLTPPNYLLEQQQQDSKQLQQHQHQPVVKSALNALMGALGQMFGASESAGQREESGQQQQSLLLLPLSCLLLLSITSLASYLYYSNARASRLGGAKRQAAAAKPSQSGAGVGVGGARTAATLQLLDRHLIGRARLTCLHNNSSSASSSGSSAASNCAAGQHQRQHHSQAVQLVLGSGYDLEQQPADEAQADFMPAFDAFLSQSQHSQTVPQFDFERERQLARDLNHANSNSFLACEQTLLNDDEAPHSNAYQPGNASPSDGCKTHTLTPYGPGALMKLLTAQQAQLPAGSARSGAYFDCAASSSSGLGGSGSGTTSAVGASVPGEPQACRLLATDESHLQTTAPAPNGYDFADCEPPFDGCPSGTPAHSDHVNLVHQQRDELSKHHHQQFDELLLTNSANGQLFCEDQEVNGEPELAERRQLERALSQSASFVSASDLLRRQQADCSESADQEPIYQRLDKFKGRALPACATLLPARLARQAVAHQLQLQYQNPPSGGNGQQHFYSRTLTFGADRERQHASAASFACPLGQQASGANGYPQQQLSSGNYNM